MIEKFRNKEKLISVIGLGYVGLPLAIEFAKFFKVIAFDINEERVNQMKNGFDPSEELSSDKFENIDILFTSDPEELCKASIHIIAVPTDINKDNVPNLGPLQSASHTTGKYLKEGDIVVYESTVYPGCTEDECIPILERESNLVGGKDFFVAYSPERIVPGDKIRTLTNILKIVSANDKHTLDLVSELYSAIITAGIYKANSIKVAEAAKVIENTQRDLNISLMNELSIIFDRLNIDTREVIKAAATKWNFHEYYPGLVGGHCISVDPFYLIHKAREVGYEPQVIAAGRMLNDQIPNHITKTLVQKLISHGKNPGKSKVLVQGITFKENVSDIRNSKVVDLVKELMAYSVNVHVIDPYASANQLAKDYSITLMDKAADDYDAVIVAVSHIDYAELDEEYYLSITNQNPIMFDLKALYEPMTKLDYWRL